MALKDIDLGSAMRTVVSWPLAGAGAFYKMEMGLCEIDLIFLKCAFDNRLYEREKLAMAPTADLS